MAESGLDKKKLWKSIYEQENVASRMAEIASKKDEGITFELPLFGVVKLVIATASGLGDNYLSDTYYNTATLSDGVVHRAFIKVLPSNPLLRAEAMNFNVYSREIATYCYLHPFFREMRLEKGLEAAEIPLKVPEIYHTNLDTTVAGESAESATVLVMEELNFQGFRMVDKRYGCTREGAMEILSALGNFHALSCTWLKKHKNADGSYSLPPSVDFILTPMDFKDLIVGMFRTTWSNSIKVLQHFGLSEAAEWLEGQEKYIDEIFDVPDLLKAGPLACICHGDCWSNNFLFHFDDNGAVDDVRIVDWQTLIPDSAGRDVYHFLTSTTTPELRKECGQELLEHYVDTFISAVKKLGVCLEEEGLNRDSVMAEIQKKMRYGFFFGLLMAPALLDQSMTAKLEEMGKREDATDRTEKSEDNKEDPFVEAQKSMTVEVILENKLLCQRIIGIVEEFRSKLN